MAALAVVLEDSLRGDCGGCVTQFGQIRAAREIVIAVVEEAKAAQPTFAQ